MKKKRGFFGKVFIGLVVLVLIGAFFGGGKTKGTKETAAAAVQEQIPAATPVQAAQPQPTAAAPEETNTAAPAGETPSQPEESPAQEAEVKSTGIRPELKEFLDSYEAFMDEYCEFMESYNASDITMLTKYAELLAKYSDFAEKVEKWNSEDMNNEELIYYTEVNTRVSVKLLKVSQTL